MCDKVQNVTIEDVTMGRSRVLEWSRATEEPVKTDERCGRPSTKETMNRYLECVI
jgi:hypothetical protein